MNDNSGVNYDVEIMYPRIHMAGFDMSYPLTWLFDIGFRAEAALYFPEEITFGVLVDPQLNKLAKEELKKDIEITSHNVSGDPFVKATVGLDYTFTSWFYVNAMYVRGFIDEFDDLSGTPQLYGSQRGLQILRGRIADQARGRSECGRSERHTVPSSDMDCGAVGGIDRRYVDFPG